MALVGKSGLVADVGDLISGAQARFGKFDACHIHKAGGRQAPLLFTVVELLGAAYLLWIGSLLLRSRPTTLDVRSASASRPSRVKQLLLGLGSSLLNPKNALFYLALMTSLLGPDVTLMQQAVSGVWMTSIVLLWDLLLVTMIALPAFPPSSGALSGRPAAY